MMRSTYRRRGTTNPSVILPLSDSQPVGENSAARYRAKCGTVRADAKREAWDGAGAIGKVHRKLFGQFRYANGIIDGQQVKPLVKVHILRVRRLKKWFLEITQLDLIWLKAAEAVKRANEPGLKRPLRSVDRKLDGRS
jgi:hypothetical protein